MIEFASDYCKKHTIGGKKIGAKTFRKRLENGIYPPNTECKKLSKGWVIYHNDSKPFQERLGLSTK